MLNHILDPISVKYCKFKINQYCEESKSFLEDLKVWKRSFKDNDCPNTVDIVNLYYTLLVIIVENAIKESLKSCSNYS